jgi:hypothetical protein
VSCAAYTVKWYSPFSRSTDALILKLADHTCDWDERGGIILQYLAIRVLGLSLSMPCCLQCPAEPAQLWRRGDGPRDDAAVWWGQHEIGERERVGLGDLGGTCTGGGGLVGRGSRVHRRKGRQRGTRPQPRYIVTQIESSAVGMHVL